MFCVLGIIISIISGPDVVGVLKVLLERQECMGQTLQMLILMVQRIHRLLAPEEKSLTIPRGIPSLPLQTESEFESLQAKLEDENIFYPLV